MLQQLALATTYGLLLVAVGWGWQDWQFWSFLALFWAINTLGRIQGRVEGIVTYIDMSEHDQQRLKRALAKAREEQ